MSSPASTPSPAAATPPTLPAAPAKFSSRGCWAYATAVIGLQALFFAINNPLTAALSHVDSLRQMVVRDLPVNLQEFGSQVIVALIEFSVRTPFAIGVTGWVLVSVIVWFIARPLLTSFGSALLTHLLLLVTGGAKGEIGGTMRAFGINRGNVELATILLALAVILAPWPLAAKFLIVLFGVPFIRLVGMVVLMARLTTYHELSAQRIIWVLAPLFVFAAVISIVQSLVTVAWLALYCTAKGG